MTPLTDWALRWGIPMAALEDLQRVTLGMDGGPGDDLAGTSEAAIQTQVRIAASRRGWRLWRNNVGAVHDTERGVHVRYGLANDSPAVNEIIKSADLIGIRPLIIQPGDVGKLVGQFISYEVKHGGWTFKGTDREEAQARWAQLVVSLGGHAQFIADPRAL